MGTWATASDVTDRWVGEAPPDGRLEDIDVQIGDAEALIRSEFPDIDERIAVGATTVENLRIVVARMVIRVLRNPEGVRTRQDTTGPYNNSVTYGGDHPGALYLTDDDRSLIERRRSGPRAFTITPYQTPAAHPPVLYTDQILNW